MYCSDQCQMQIFSTLSALLYFNTFRIFIDNSLLEHYDTNKNSKITVRWKLEKTMTIKETYGVSKEQELWKTVSFCAITFS